MASRVTNEDSKDIDLEMEKALEEARKADQTFQVEPTSLDNWLNKFGIDPFSTQPKSRLDEQGGETIDGKYYPNPRTLRDPQLVKQWAELLYKDVLELIVQDPEIPSHQIRSVLMVKEVHLDIIKYYPYIFERITSNPLNPPYYMKILRRMCDAQTRIRQGENVDQVEAELQAYFMKYKEQSCN